MERPAQPSHPIHELLRKRWSPRSFLDRPVEPAKLLSILEAARWAASSYNDQPWSYIVAAHADAEEYKRLLSCLVEQNQKWAAKAPVLMISVYSTVFGHNGKPNRCAPHDVGAASAQLTLQATDLGLSVHQMGGIYPDKVKQTYGLPDTGEPMAALAIGYCGEPDTLPEDFRKLETSPRTRKPLSEFVYTGKWGQAAAWVKA